MKKMSIEMNWIEIEMNDDDDDCWSTRTTAEKKKGLIWIKYQKWCAQCLNPNEIAILFSYKQRMNMYVLMRYGTWFYGLYALKSIINKNKRIMISSIVWTLRICVCKCMRASKVDKVCKSAYTKHDAIYHSTKWDFISCEWNFSNLSISRQIQFISMAFYFFLDELKKKKLHFVWHKHDTHNTEWEICGVWLCLFYSQTKIFSSESIFV